jgi:hypothetical protein
MLSRNLSIPAQENTQANQEDQTERVLGGALEQVWEACRAQTEPGRMDHQGREQEENDERRDRRCAGRLDQRGPAALPGVRKERDAPPSSRRRGGMCHHASRNRMYCSALAHRVKCEGGSAARCLGDTGTRFFTLLPSGKHDLPPV